MAEPSRHPRDVGRAALRNVRRSVTGTLNQRLAALVSSDPEVMASAVELGLVSRDWLKDPVGSPISTTAPRDVLQRFLERQVERRPSILSEVGLSALNLFSSRGTEADPTEAMSAPVAIVFTDLVGFTTFTEREGDDAAADLLQRHTLTVGPIIRSRGGTIVKRLGDGLLVTFPQPEAAVLAALDLVRASPEPLPMRAGVHWGEAFVTRDDVVGHDVNVAARVADVARPTEVLVTVETRDACRGLPGVEFGRMGRRRVKGLDEPVKVCSARRDDTPTMEVPFVGAEGR